jgi:hypothetical protein
MNKINLNLVTPSNQFRLELIGAGFASLSLPGDSNVSLKKHFEAEDATLRNEAMNNKISYFSNHVFYVLNRSEITLIVKVGIADDPNHKFYLNGLSSDAIAQSQELSRPWGTQYISWNGYSLERGQSLSFSVECNELSNNVLDVCTIEAIACTPHSNFWGSNYISIYYDNPS